MALKGLEKGITPMRARRMITFDVEAEIDEDGVALRWEM